MCDMKALDYRILKELENDAKASNVVIAKKLKVSEGTVRKRIQEMIKSNIIRRFTVELSTKAGFTAFVLARSQTQIQSSVIASKVRKIEDVKSVYQTAGEYDFVIEVVTSSPEKFNETIEKIRSVQGITQTESLTVLKID